MNKSLITKALIVFFLVICISSACEGRKRYEAKSYLGEKAPELVVEEWLTSEPETEGKFVLIGLWTTWCTGNGTFVNMLNRLQKKYENDLVIIGICTDKKEEVIEYDTPRIEFYSAVDMRRRMYWALELTMFPYAIIVDPDGYVVWEGYPLRQSSQLTDLDVYKLIQGWKESGKHSKSKNNEVNVKKENKVKTIDDIKNQFMER